MIDFKNIYNTQSKKYDILVQHEDYKNNILYNNRINSGWLFRCAPLPAGYAERCAAKLTNQHCNSERQVEGII